MFQLEQKKSPVQSIMGNSRFYLQACKLVFVQQVAAVISTVADRQSNVGVTLHLFLSMTWQMMSGARRKRLLLANALSVWTSI